MDLTNAPPISTIIIDTFYRIIRETLNNWFYIVQSKDTMTIWDQRNNNDKKIGAIWIDLERATIGLRAINSAPFKKPLQPLKLDLVQHNSIDLAEQWCQQFIERYK